MNICQSFAHFDNIYFDRVKTDSRDLLLQKNVNECKSEYWNAFFVAKCQKLACNLHEISISLRLLCFLKTCFFFLPACFIHFKQTNQKYAYTSYLHNKNNNKNTYLNVYRFYPHAQTRGKCIHTHTFSLFNAHRHMNNSIGFLCISFFLVLVYPCTTTCAIYYNVVLVWFSFCFVLKTHTHTFTSPACLRLSFCFVYYSLQFCLFPFTLSTLIRMNERNIEHM